MKHIPTAQSYRLCDLVPSELEGDASVRIYLTDLDLFIRREPESQSLDKIQQFELTDLLLFTTKIALTLDRDDGSLNPVFQFKIAQDLLLPEVFHRYKTINKILEYFANRKQRSFEIAPLVTSLHTLNFLKRVIISHQDNGKRVIHLTDSPGSHQTAFELLLRLGNCLGTKASTNTTGEAISELVRSSIFFHREAPDVLIGRMYRLFFQLPNLRPFNDPLQNLAALFENATQVSLNEYFSLGVGLLTKFAQASLLRYDTEETPDPNTHAVLNWTSWFNTV